MKAIRVHEFGGPEVLRLENVPDPRPGPGQVVVAVHAVGINPVETYIRAGIYGKRDFPFIPGTDAAGVVQAVGEGVRRVDVGQRVYVAGSLSGTYAQSTLCKESQVHRLPEPLLFAQGAAIGIPYATAHRALFGRGQAKPGESVLVHGGTGGVGTAAVQLARAAGLTIYATGGTERGLELLAQQGAHHVLNHHAPDYLKHLMSLTDGRGVDLILEMLANVNLAKDLSILAKFGRVVVIGSRGPVEIMPRETMAHDADIRGMTLFNVPEHDLAGIHAALIAGLENATLRPIIGRELPLSAAAQAHELVMSPGAYGKIVLIP